ncbi:MAG: DUF2975 domain-containing protein [Lachnospiraceae bacterium]|nr:DUF2975 domain-containing protein [Lachnospiraceae bacterium]
MEQKALARLLKGCLIGLGIVGLVVYGMIIPMYGQSVVVQYPEFSYCYLPWLIFLWITAIPCYAVLVIGWRIAGKIGEDRSFCYENAKWLKWIAWLAFGDTIFFFVGNVILLFLGMNHPGIALFSLVVDFVGVAIGVASAALSHLVQKAAEMQEQSDLTI